MNGKENRFAALTEKAAVYVVGSLSLLIAFFLFAVSMLHTTAVETVREGEGVYSIVWDIKEKLESVIYYNDNFVLNLVMLGIGVLLLFLLIAKVKKLPLRVLQIILFVWTFLLGTVWVLSSQVCPSEDSMTVTSAALQFSQDNFDLLSSSQYFHNYPFQLGYVLFNEGVIRFLSLFKRPETVMVLEVLNAFFLAMIHTLLLSLCARLFRDDRVNLVAAVLLGISAAPVIDCTFTYGIYPGMAFAILAMYLELRWLNESKPLFAVGAVLSIAVAMMLKSNYLIWMIAMVLIWLVKMPARKRWVVDGMFIAATVVLCMAVQPTVRSIYQKRSGVDLGDSIPYASWIAMGLSESDLAPGWYNIYITVGNFEQSDYNAEEAGRRSMEHIKERLKYFAENPQYTNDFFYRKIVSQWNEPSYQSIWNNTVRYQYKDKNAFAHWVCFEGERPVKRYMDLFAQMVFFGFFLSTLYLLKRKEFLFTMVPVVFLGGFFYQLISEGKAQYIIPYFILMTGYAAFGTVSLYDYAAARVRKESLLGKLLAVRAGAEGSAAPEASAESPQESAEAPASGETAADAAEAVPESGSKVNASDQKSASGKKQAKHKKGAKK